MNPERKRPRRRTTEAHSSGGVFSLTPKEATLALHTHKVLETLTPREAQILRLRFGIPDYSTQIEALEHFALSPAQTRDAVEEVRSLTPELLEHLRKREGDLEKLPWDVFEHLIAEFFASWGSPDVRLVGRDSDTQADVFALHEVHPAGVRLRYFIEVKRTRERVGVEVINQVYGAFAIEQPKHGWTVAMIVSLAGFTGMRRFPGPALERRNLYLRDGSDVVTWLRNYRFGPNGLWLPNPKRTLGKLPTEGGRTKRSSRRHELP